MNPHITSTRDIILSLETELGKTILGQEKLIRKIIIALFAGGHVLLEGVPGIGKTKTAKTLASILGYEFKRISFTPDLLPTDLTGNEIYRPQTGKFEVRKGPIFTHILLADEINRTPPKVQSALLEAMEEGQVTIATETLTLPEFFFVIATENPLEHEGTYPLPEAQLDRFFMKILLDYPEKDAEKQILAHTKNESQAEKKSMKLSPDELLEMRAYISEHIHIDEKIIEYVSDILAATRIAGHPHIAYGASTRAGLALLAGARVHALLEGREHVLPDDVKMTARDILRHRIGLTYAALTEKISTDSVIAEILESINIA